MADEAQGGNSRYTRRDIVKKAGVGAGGLIVAGSVAGTAGARPIRVTHEAVPEANQLRIVVRDDGSGIAPGLLEHLFLPHVTTGSSGGSRGLGLHIVETIVKQHGGYVRAANRRDAKGAEFTIVLPSKPQAIPARAS